MRVRGIPPYTGPQLKIEALKEHNFTANTAARLKSRKTGKPMPIYLVNLLLKANFQEICQIQELCYLKVTIERFRGSNIVKQCYRCQGYGHASEICRFKPKCLKCAKEHLSKDCSETGKFTSTCANCSCPHVAAYRGCHNYLPNFKEKRSSLNNPLKIFQKMIQII